MTNYASEIDFEEAKNNPSLFFSSPAEIGRDTALTTKQKVELLRSWAYDASELSVAEEEGMMGSDPDVRSLIFKELDSLVSTRDEITIYEPPTKHGSA